MSKKLALALLSGATLALGVSGAQAHIELTAPTPRVPGVDDLKADPCGPGNAWGQGEVLTFAPGETVLVEWDETISHAGYFRVALGTTGDGSLSMPTEEDYEAFTALYTDGSGDVPEPIDAPLGMAVGEMILYYDYFAPHAGQMCAGTEAGGTCSYSVEITMPDSCEECTLQVIQTMAESFRTYGSNAHYYHCADIRIEGEPVGGDDGEGGAGGAGEGGAGGGPDASGQGGAGGAMLGTGGDGAEPPDMEPVDPEPGAPVDVGSMGGSTGAPPVEPTPVVPTGQPAAPGPEAVTPTPTAPAPAPNDSAPVTPAANPSSVPMVATSSGGNDDGGCSLNPTSDDGKSWLVLLGVLAATRRRRRR